MDLITCNQDLISILRCLDSVDGRPVIVGGAVRDALLGDHNPKDIDIECYGIDFGKVVLALSGIADVDVVGAQFQVATVRLGGESYDIALPRTEVKTGSGHTGFEVDSDPNMTFEKASLRRDFTINAIGWDPISDKLLDPHGGYRDLKKGILRHVGPQFAEDPLRVLRAMQFAARFRLLMATETVEMCRSLKDEFHTLSIERVWGEWEKLCTRGVMPSLGIQVLFATEWIDHFPELKALRGVPQDEHWHPEGDVLTHSAQAMDAAAFMYYQDDRDRVISVLGALVHDFGKSEFTQIHEDGRITSHGHAAGGVDPATNFLLRIGAPAWTIAPIQNITREHMCIVNGDPTPTTVRRLARRLAPATMLQWMKVVEADQQGRCAHDEPSVGNVGIGFRWLQVANEVQVDKEPSKPILKGEQIMALGLKPGPVFAKIIAASVEAQDEGTITDEQSAEDWLEDHWREFI